MKLGIGTILDLLDLDFGDIVEQGEEYIVGQVKDFIKGMDIAADLDLLPNTWKGLRKAGKAVAGHCKEHGTPTEGDIRAALA